MLYDGLDDREAGTKFEQQILSQLRKTEGIWIHPLSDTRSASRGSEVRFINPQPSDFAGVVTGGMSVYLEAKASRIHPGLDQCSPSELRSLIRKNQATAARQVSRLSGRYCFLFLDREGHKVKLYEGNNIALRYMDVDKEAQPPLVEMEWSNRDKFCDLVVENLTEQKYE